MLLCLVLPMPLFALGTINISPSIEKLDLGRHCETLEDPQGTLSIAEAADEAHDPLFVPSPGTIPNFGFTKSVYWARISMENHAGAARDLLLEVGFPLLDNVEFYILEKGKKTGFELLKKETTGRDFPFTRRVIRHRNFVFSIHMPAGAVQTVYLRFKTADGMIFPMTLWTPPSFMKKTQREQFAFGIYYGIILIMILYNLFIFFSTRDRNYLYYVLYIFFFGMFQMAMNGLAVQYLWPEFPWWAIHANPFLIGMSILMSTFFTMHFLDTAYYTPVADKLLKILMGLSGVLAVLALVISYSITIVAGQILPLACILIAIPTAVIILKKGNRSARFYLIAWSTFLVGIILSTLRVMGIIPHNFLTEHGLQIGSGFEMVLLSLALADRINIMKKEKDDAQQELITSQQRNMEDVMRSRDEIEEAHRLLSISESKYRLLVEGTSDIVFSLDENWNFITSNRAILTEFKIDPATVSSRNFLDLIYSDQAEHYVTKQLVLEKLDEFSRTKKPIQFRTHFISPIISEPKEMQVRLEYLDIEGKNEILGKASRILDDSLLKYFDSERQKYVIGNLLITAEDITHRLTRNLKKYVPARDANYLRLALREIIINAIEHGNLGITFEEKSKAMNEDHYFEFIARRQLAPGATGKKIAIEYSVDTQRVVYIITDDGAGFDHSHFLKNAINTANEEMLSHGRGIAMTMNAFDRVQYNEKGNQVMLIKYFSELPG